MVVFQRNGEIFEIESSSDELSANIESHHIQPEKTYQVEVVHRSRYKHACKNEVEKKKLYRMIMHLYET
jgi:hypothetical protein